jgi:AraC-like DNA-binding protein
VQELGTSTIGQRIQQAASLKSKKFIRFNPRVAFSWGLETRRPGDAYSWSGMRRGVSPERPLVLFQYTLAGRGAYEEAGTKWSLEADRSFAVLLPSAHRYFLPPDSTSWTFFWFWVRHPFVADRFRELRRKEAAVQTWGSNSLVLERAVELIEEASLSRWREVWSFEEQLVGFLLAMERESHHRRYPQDESERLLNETRRIILSRMERPPGVEDLAQAWGLERTTFSRHFKSKTGVSPAAFITDVRLDEAVKLLGTRAKLKEIAARTGFADDNHFCKVFKAHFSHSPGAYRKLLDSSARR